MLVDWLSFIALIGYVVLTYILTKEKYNPLVSFYLSQIQESHIGFNMQNLSKVEVEVFGIIWVRIGKKLFEYKTGFYGNRKKWVLQPKTKVFGHFNLNQLQNEEGENIENALNKIKKDDISFNVEIKYRRIIKNKLLNKFLRGKWKYRYPQRYYYNFLNRGFWLDV